MLVAPNGRRFLWIAGGSQQARATAGSDVEALRGNRHLSLHWAEPLPSKSLDWRWPLALEQADGLLFHLHLPLSAADLLWLQAQASSQSGSGSPSSSPKYAAA